MAPKNKRKSGGGEGGAPKAKKGKESSDMGTLDSKQLAMEHVKLFKQWL